MSNEHDKGMVVFSEDADIEELKRIEKTVNESLPSVGLTFDGGVVLASATRSYESDLMNKDNLSSVFNVGERAGMVSAGRVADAQSLAEDMRDKALEDIQEFGQLEDVNILAREVAEDVRETKQEIPYRPYGVQMIVGGLNGRGDPSLYMIDIDGVMTSWSAVAVGSNSNEIIEDLERRYQETDGADECVQLAISVLLKYSDVEPSGLSVAVITDDSDLHRLDSEEINNYMENVGDKDD